MEKSVWQRFVKMETKMLDALISLDWPFAIYSKKKKKLQKETKTSSTLSFWLDQDVIPRLTSKIIMKKRSVSQAKIILPSPLCPKFPQFTSKW